MPIRQRRFPLILAIACLVSLGVYLIASLVTYRLGFPLDDAWIHQTYARNLVDTHQWVYIPGQVSAGSTAPLWTFILALSYLLHLGPYAWTYFLGAFCLWGLALIGEYGYRHLSGKWEHRFPWVGLMLVFEWHLVWSAGSGMETLAFSLLVLGVLVGLVARVQCWWLYGLLAGVSCWIRPDGLTLIGPIGLTVLLTIPTWWKRVKAFASILGSFVLAFLPYLWFNYSLAGSIWPNTFYAKQAEYAILQVTPFIIRYAGELQLSLVGVGAVLLPGVIIFVIRATRQKKWGALAGILWWVIYLGIYAWRLPVTYQHGRYIIPAMPLFFLWGISGYSMVKKELEGKKWVRVIGKAWGVSIVLLLIIFWGIGAITYGGDVAIIESEMVDTARWIETHTHPQDVIAAHDIGALGYYSRRPIIDLAGLITPEAIPFIRNEDQLAVYIRAKNASYLVVFPDWYPDLVHSLQPVYSTDAPFAKRQGYTNMTVYSLSR